MGTLLLFKGFKEYTTSYKSTTFFALTYLNV